jgi:hypothetical protein
LVTPAFCINFATCILSKFIERGTTIPHGLRPEDPVVFVEREREVLHLP